MTIKRIAVLVCLLLAILPLNLSRSVRAIHGVNTVYLYVEIESKVYKKGVDISSANPAERRWYFSNVVIQPEDVASYLLVKQRIMPYFSRNVMDPFEARGFSLDYGEQDVRVCGENSRANYDTKAEADESLAKEIEYRKGQSGNIYSFELSWGAAKGEETSKPKLIYRDKDQPNYGGK